MQNGESPQISSVVLSERSESKDPYPHYPGAISHPATGGSRASPTYAPKFLFQSSAKPTPQLSIVHSDFPTQQKRRGQSLSLFFGAGDRDRTGTLFTARDFKSLVSACSTTPAWQSFYHKNAPPSRETVRPIPPSTCRGGWCDPQRIKIQMIAGGNHTIMH